MCFFITFGSLVYKKESVIKLSEDVYIFLYLLIKKENTVIKVKIYDVLCFFDSEKENYMIRFICKTGFNLRSRDDITEDVIVNNNNLKFQKESIYTPIIDFVSNQHFFVFDKENDGLKKNLITKVRVRVEVEKK